MERKYVVWVGGVEVNNYYLTEGEAEEMAQDYIELGYDDVTIEKVA